MSNIAIVVPTIRPESYATFIKKWDELFTKHKIELITVWDGEKPYISHDDIKYSVDDVMGKYKDVIYNKNDGVRNLGFAFVAKFLPRVEYIITLDDDCYPNNNDPIEEHIQALNMRVPTSWISTATHYMRGFPYGVRNEAEVVLSHGVWENVKDWDAATQLTHGNRDVTFYKGSIPKGIMYPMCIMNVAFKRKILPYMYQAPMGEKIGLDRFADIWCGIESKKMIDSLGLAVVSGYSTIWHDRASNVFVNLVKEAKGIGLNEVENYGKGEYFKLYKEKRKRFLQFASQYV
jgi:reversibly glycosylated polypeptide/UDP-arabinopyranose mutase